MSALRRVIYGSWAFNIFGRYSGNNDVLPSEMETAIKERNNENQTGRDRLRQMYSLDEFGNLSMELQTAKDACLLGFFVGGCVGAFMSTRSTYMDFIEHNEATRFRSHMDAKKKLQDKMTVSLGKGFWRWGWRVGLFSGTFMLCTSTISTYRNKHGILEYIAAGAMTGSFYRMNLGARGIIVGGGLGGVLGAFAGALTLGIMKLGGISMEELRYWQYNWKYAKKSEIDMEQRKKRPDVIDQLMMVHDKGLEKAGLPSEENKEKK